MQLQSLTKAARALFLTQEHKLQTRDEILRGGCGPGEVAVPIDISAYSRSLHNETPTEGANKPGGWEHTALVFHY